MLKPIFNQLKSQRIILASGSPRRQELSKSLGINVELCPSLFEENLKIEDFPSFKDFVEETALQKVLEVSDRLSKLDDAIRPPDLIIGADTMVTLGSEMYGKPGTPEKAFEVLSILAGKPHIVYTGVVIKKGDTIIKFTEEVKVKFGEASSEQIQAYVDTGDPLDKAGAYGIQGLGGSFVESIEGDYFAVMGFPMYRICKELCKLYGYEK